MFLLPSLSNLTVFARGGPVQTATSGTYTCTQSVCVSVGDTPRSCNETGLQFQCVGAGLDPAHDITHNDVKMECDGNGDGLNYFYLCECKVDSAGCGKSSDSAGMLIHSALARQRFASCVIYLVYHSTITLTMPFELASSTSPKQTATATETASTVVPSNSQTSTALGGLRQVGCQSILRFVFFSGTVVLLLTGSFF
jgi:hypothetical protein